MKNIIFLLGLCILFFPIYPQAQTDKKYIRKNASTAEAKEDLLALKVALDSMRKLDCSNPLSWYYQGALHWIPDTVEDNKLCESYHHSPRDLKLAWNNCTHDKWHQIHFLSWHRFYIYHFEKIVRHLSGKEDFALPYWDYTNPDHSKGYLIMPAAFREPADQKLNALYEHARLPSLNNGEPIQGDSIKKDSIFLAIDVTNLFENTDFACFNQIMDKAPHGAMHNYIGGIYSDTNFSIWNPIFQKNTSGLMGQVPSAGFDPIFWLHHSNIDYLWEKWTRSKNGRKVSLDTLERNCWNYQFFEPDGRQISYTTREMYKLLYDLDYSYDQLENSFSPNLDENPSLTLKTPKNKSLLSLNPRQNIDTRNWELEIALEKKLKPGKTFSPKTTYRLVIEVSARTEPKSLYDVYVNLPQAGTKIEEITPILIGRHLAGHMTFFGAGHHAAHHGDHGMIHEKFCFDISHELIAHNAKKNKKVLRLSFHRNYGPKDEVLRIENIELVQVKR